MFIKAIELNYYAINLNSKKGHLLQHQNKGINCYIVTKVKSLFIEKIG